MLKNKSDLFELVSFGCLDMSVEIAMSLSFHVGNPHWGRSHLPCDLNVCLAKNLSKSIYFLSLDYKKHNYNYTFATCCSGDVIDYIQTEKGKNKKDKLFGN